MHLPLGRISPTPIYSIQGVRPADGRRRFHRLCTPRRFHKKGGDPPGASHERRRCAIQRSYCGGFQSREGIRWGDFSSPGRIEILDTPVNSEALPAEVQSPKSAPALPIPDPYWG